MSAFAEDVKRFTVKVENVTREVFINTASHVQESIVNGSVVTGAPGQPVDTGNLKNSWHLAFTGPGFNLAEITTNVSYAKYIEDGVVPLGSRRGNVTGHTRQRLVLRSEVGGFHSVALTLAGLPRIIEHEVAKVAK